MDSPSLHRIVLTGGPCAGKTTALARISERLQSLGFEVYLVPEAATTLILGGASFAGLSGEKLLHAQATLMKLQLNLEDAFVALARSCGRKAVVICDRGAMDSAAYMPAATWQALLDEHDWTVVGLRDKRYEAVIHLVTAAKGAEAFYSTANNAARTEPLELAREIDSRIQDAWVGHPHLRVVDNGGDFTSKIWRVIEAVCHVVGVPEPVENERKFLVRSVREPLPVRCEEIEIEQTYLCTGDGSEARVRRRGQNGSYTYMHTTKRPLREGQRVEIERPISAREATALLLQADPSRNVVKKRRRCFLYEGQYFELDQFVDPMPGLLLLEAEIEDETAGLVLPPFVEIEREVTADSRYSNFSMASRG